MEKCSRSGKNRCSRSNKNHCSRSARISVHDGQEYPANRNYCIRALILAAFSEGNTVTHNFIYCGDTQATLEALVQLGIKIETFPNKVVVHGNGRQCQPNTSLININESATLARILMALLCTLKISKIRLNGSHRMHERPMEPLIAALIALGADIHCIKSNGFLPVLISGKELSGGLIKLDSSLSSQYCTALIIAGCFTQSAIHITQENRDFPHKDFIIMTLSTVKHFGGCVLYDDELENIIIKPSPLKAKNFSTEGDLSFFGWIVAAACMTKHVVKILDFPKNSLQPDMKIIPIYEQLGVAFIQTQNDILIQPPLICRGGFEINCQNISDQTLNLAAISAIASAPLTLSHIHHIKYQESDRILAIQLEYQKLGIPVKAGDDYLTIYPADFQGGVVSDHNDHRVGLSLLLLFLRNKHVLLSDNSSIKKSCPDYLKYIQMFNAT